MNYISYHNKKDNILIYLLVFAAWWQFMLGLHLFEGGLTIIWRTIHGELILYFWVIITALIADKKYKFFEHSIINKHLVIVFSVFYIPILWKAFWYGSFGAILPFLLIIVFLRLKDDIKIRILDLFIKTSAITLSLSIAEYLICVLTGQYVVLFSSIPTETYREFDQSLFNFIPLNDQISFGPFLFFRFQSLSDEPGNIGTICAFLLFATSKSIRYRYAYIVFWIAGILSLSVAFFILAAIHIAFSFSKQGFNVLLICGIILFILYINFQEVFDFFVFNRFSQGSIGLIDNRSTEEFDAHLLAAFEDGTLWFGKGLGVEMDTGGHGGVAGIKAFMWIYGILGTIIVLTGYILCYISIQKKRPLSTKRRCTVFLLVFLLSFYQREYITYFDYIIIFFTMPLLIYNNVESKEDGL